MPPPTFPSGVSLRPLRATDAAALAQAYRDNREHLAPWEPLREDGFFTEAGQAEQIARRLEGRAAGTDMPWVLATEERIIGTMTLSGIVHGPFLSAHVGYWVARWMQGRGVCSTALQDVLRHARDELGLHRVQASVLPHNTAWTTVLRRAGFTLIGTAPSYLRIAGSWQDHLLYQRILH
ncbi:GNAT family N-acetyltransferase [Arthrobacter sp. SX1312]|uniref:GNAT family N-acetyltransferase n=1 Tax=Arthrobacter sp. SX1312 TaxID=2058896 RepID=UPI000CE2B895|nr:GNAT family N-acetyltransferase [Arthrobacter sp. SX1312]